MVKSQFSSPGVVSWVALTLVAGLGCTETTSIPRANPDPGGGGGTGGTPVDTTTADRPTARTNCRRVSREESLETTRVCLMVFPFLS